MSFDYSKVFEILEKGLRVIPILIDTGSDVIGLVNRMTKVAADAKDGKKVDPQEIGELEAELDTALAEFNAPLPPE